MPSEKIVTGSTKVEQAPQYARTSALRSTATVVLVCARCEARADWLGATRTAVWFGCAECRHVWREDQH